MRLRRFFRGLFIFAALIFSGWTPQSAGSVALACSDEMKAGTVELHPNGTANAIEFVEFDKPFCSGPIVVTATVNNQNTAGEMVGVQAFGAYGVSVSIQLDAPSDADYGVYWVAVRATQ